MRIYKTTNLINNKFYIGQEKNDSDSYLGSGKILKNAIQKYGKQNFRKEILEICENEKELDEKEIYWIKKLNATNRKIGYNICEGGRVNRTMTGKNHPMYGKKHSIEMRMKISDNTKKGMTAEVRQKIKDKRKFQVFSEKTRKLWSEHRKGNSAYGRKGVLNVHYGIPITEEHKLKISIANSGEKNGMYGKCGELNNSATKYVIETPDGNIIEIIGREAVAKYLNCSYGVFTSKKYNGYKIIDKIRINKNR
jgi:group I intron endonuclease